MHWFPNTSNYLNSALPKSFPKNNPSSFPFIGQKNLERWKPTFWRHSLISLNSIKMTQLFGLKFVSNVIDKKLDPSFSSKAVSHLNSMYSKYSAVLSQSISTHYIPSAAAYSSWIMGYMNIWSSSTMHGGFYQPSIVILCLQLSYFHYKSGILLLPIFAQM